MSQVPDGIMQSIRAVIENAYLRAALTGTKKTVTTLSATERGGLLETYKRDIDADVTFLRVAFTQYTAINTAQQIGERMEDVELKPVVFDTEDPQ